MACKEHQHNVVFDVVHTHEASILIWGRQQDGEEVLVD